MALTSLLLRFTHTAAILWQHQKETALLQVRMYCLSWLVIGTSVYLTPHLSTLIYPSKPALFVALFVKCIMSYVLFHRENTHFLWVHIQFMMDSFFFLMPHASHTKTLWRDQVQSFFLKVNGNCFEELQWPEILQTQAGQLVRGWFQAPDPSQDSECLVLSCRWPEKSHKLSWALCQQRILDYPHDCPLQGSINHNIMPWQNYGRWWRSILEHPGHLLSPQSNALTLQFCVPNHKIEAIILIFQDWYEA